MQFRIVNMVQPVKLQLSKFSSLVLSVIRSNSILTSSKGPNRLCRYKRVSLQARCMVEVKEEYFKTRYRPAGILVNVNAMIYFKVML